MYYLYLLNYFIYFFQQTVLSLLAVLSCVLRHYVCDSAIECVEDLSPPDQGYSTLAEEYQGRTYGPLFHMIFDKSHTFPEIGLNEKYVYSLSRNKTCPKSIDTKSVSTEEKSTCPFYVKLSYDDDRRPRLIPFAACRCRRCISVDGCDKDCQARTVCRAVYTYKIVYRRTCKTNGSGEWFQETVKIPVGCTCSLVNTT